MKKILVILFCLPILVFGQNPNYSEHVAPIIYNKCLQCHHNNGIAPLSFENYANVITNTIVGSDLDITNMYTINNIPIVIINDSI